MSATAGIVAVNDARRAYRCSRRMRADWVTYVRTVESVRLAVGS